MKKSGSIWHTLFSSFGQYEEGNLIDVSKSLLWNLVLKSVRLKLQLQELINSERCFLPRTCFFHRFSQSFHPRRSSSITNPQYLPKTTVTWCDLSARSFCIDATLLCEFESDKI